jgi:hypothetical protein
MFIIKIIIIIMWNQNVIHFRLCLLDDCHLLFELLNQFQKTNYAKYFT